MTLVAIGINHKTAPVELREKVAFSSDALVDALASLRDATGVEESVIVSTCNRTEVYAMADKIQPQNLVSWLAQFHNLDVNDVATNSYIHDSDKAVQHIMRVASGLDSLVLGEPQILGQVKQAYTSAKNSGTVGSGFDRLFQQTFAVAKRVRSETEIGANAVSVAFAAVQLAKHIFSSLQNSRVLLIGAGETIELVARHLKEQGVNQLRVANRTLERAQQLAETIDADVMTLAQIPNHLAEADIVISSTASQLPILGKGMVESALKQRKHRPMLLVDLAVPRDIEGEVADLDDAYLYTVDDLQHIVEQNLASRQSAAQDAEKLIEEQVQQYLQWSQAQGSVDVIKRYRQQNEATRDRLVARAMNQLAEGKPAEQVIEELGVKLTNGLMHAPTKALGQAAQSGDDQQLALLSQVLGITKSSQR